MKVDTNQAVKEFMEHLEAGKFDREPYPDLPPCLDEKFETAPEDYEKFLKSPIGQHIINM